MASPRRTALGDPLYDYRADKKMVFPGGSRDQIQFSFLYDILRIPIISAALSPIGSRPLRRENRQERNLGFRVRALNSFFENQEKLSGIWRNSGKTWDISRRGPFAPPRKRLSWHEDFPVRVQSRLRSEYAPTIIQRIWLLSGERTTVRPLRAG